MKNIYRVFKVDDNEFFKEIRDFFKSTPLYLIDGHHRYEAALKYMKEMKASRGEKYTGKEPFNFVLSCLFNFYDETVKISSVHRGVKKLNTPVTEIFKSFSNDYKFAALQFNNQREEMIARKKLAFLINESRKTGNLSFGFYHKAALNRYFLFTYKTKVSNVTDVDFFNKMILPKIDVSSTDIGYFYDSETPYESVKTGGYEAFFLLNGSSKEKVMELIESNKVLSPRSICFIPQIPNGLFLFSFRYSGFLTE